MTEGYNAIAKTLSPQVIEAVNTFVSGKTGVIFSRDECNGWIRLDMIDHTMYSSYLTVVDDCDQPIIIEGK